MKLLDEAHELLDGTVELRRRIHQHPELGLDLPRTRWRERRCHPMRRHRRRIGLSRWRRRPPPCPSRARRSTPLH